MNAHPYGYSPYGYTAAPVTYQGAGLGRTIGERIDRLVEKGKAVEVTQSPTLPAGVPEVTIKEAEAKFYPWYKRWWVWASVGGLALAGGATLFFVRRRK